MSFSFHYQAYYLLCLLFNIIQYALDLAHPSSMQNVSYLQIVQCINLVNDLPWHEWVAGYMDAGYSVDRAPTGCLGGHGLQNPLGAHNFSFFHTSNMMHVSFFSFQNQWKHCVWKKKLQANDQKSINGTVDDLSLCTPLYYRQVVFRCPDKILTYFL